MPFNMGRWAIIRTIFSMAAIVPSQFSYLVPPTFCYTIYIYTYKHPAVKQGRPRSTMSSRLSGFLRITSEITVICVHYLWRRLLVGFWLGKLAIGGWSRCKSCGMFSHHAHRTHVMREPGTEWLLQRRRPYTLWANLYTLPDSLIRSFWDFTIEKLGR